MSSLIDDDFKDKCYLCGLWCHTEEHHIFGGPCRNASTKYSLVVHLCHSCHDRLHHHPDGYKLKDYLHKEGQKVFEAKIGSRQQFIDEFIRSYL